MKFLLSLENNGDNRWQLIMKGDPTTMHTFLIGNYSCFTFILSLLPFTFMSYILLPLLSLFILSTCLNHLECFLKLSGGSWVQIWMDHVNTKFITTPPSVARLSWRGPEVNMVRLSYLSCPIAGFVIFFGEHTPAEPHGKWILISTVWKVVLAIHPLCLPLGRNGVIVS